MSNSAGTGKGKTISLRTKTTLVLLCTTIILIAVVYTVSNSLTLNSYKDLERKNTITDLNRMNALFTERLAALHVKSGDWANRDDTHQYMTDHNEEYVSSNLDENTFVNLDINMML